MSFREKQAPADWGALEAEWQSQLDTVGLTANRWEQLHDRHQPADLGPGCSGCDGTGGGGVEAEFVGQGGDLGPPGGERGDLVPGDTVDVCETAFDGLPRDTEGLGEVTAGDGPGDVTSGLRVMMQETGIEGLGAAVSRTDVRDHDMVMQLRFKVAVRQMPVGSCPHPVGLRRATDHDGQRPRDPRDRRRRRSFRRRARLRSCDVHRSTT